ncbi:MAG: murein biosynthesis integral membrane protein MurJ [Actinobacteria bacterium]|nr:murein biosynthesis integral membrane protein MurJ [Thermoleophilia bacterium]MCB9012043.1 murein biosynthesis integral membrane protein MurJ [Actinomycetota bacterium]
MTSGREAPTPGRQRRSSVGRSTAVFAIWTGLSRVIGLVREIIAAALFGLSGQMAAFVIAFNVPNILRSLVADSALSAALIPTYTHLVEQGREREANRLIGAVVGFTTMVLGAVTLLAVVTAPWVMPIFAPALDPETQDLTVRLSQIMFPIVLLLALTGIVSAVLQANGEFGATGFVPVLWNVLIIACMGIGALVLPPDERINAYAVGILIGTLGQLLFLLPHLRGKGPFGMHLRSPHLRRVLILMLPVTIGLGLINVNAAVDNVVAGFISEASVAAVDKAFRLYILPQGVFSVAISTVLFPAIARMVARGDNDGVGEMVTSGVRQIFFMLLPASAFLMVLAAPVVRLVYERGQFGPQDTVFTGEALITFTIGLVFNGASLLLIRAFFSLQEPWTPTRIAAIGLVLNIVFDLLLFVPLGTPGIPLSTSIVSFITFLMLVIELGKRVGRLDNAWLIDGFMRCGAAAIVLGVMSWATHRVLDDLLGRTLPAQAVSVSLALAAGTASYIAAVRAFGVPELAQLATLRRPLR